ncbi:MAG: hypothetical protein ACFFD2_16700 [Promethearchaeota archaeon]
MSKKIITLVLAIVFLGVPIFSVFLLPVYADTSWNAPVNITNDLKQDFQPTITYDPLITRGWHVAWVKTTSEDYTSDEIFYTNSSVYTTIKEQITDNNVRDWNPMIDQDSNGVVHIVWVQETYTDINPDQCISDIMYTNSNNWNIHINVSKQAKANKNWEPTLVVEKDTGIPHIAWVGGYDESPPGEIWYCKGPNGAIQAVTQGDGRSWDPSIDLDESKNVHVTWAELSWYTGWDWDVRYTNSTMWPAEDTKNFLNVSDIYSDNQQNDRRPDIDIDNEDRAHIAYYQDLAADWIYYAVSVTTNNTGFWNLDVVSPLEGDNKYPSIKVSRKINPVIIYQGIEQDDYEIWAIDFNGTWTPLDISNNVWHDTLLWSSIGALDIDGNDDLYATYYTDMGLTTPNIEVFVVLGNVVGEGIPGFELTCLLMAFLTITIVWYYLKRRSLNALGK